METVNSNIPNSTIPVDTTVAIPETASTPTEGTPVIEKVKKSPAKKKAAPVANKIAKVKVVADAAVKAPVAAKPVKKAAKKVPSAKVNKPKSEKKNKMTGASPCPPKSDAVLAKLKKQAKECGVTVRGLCILKALHHIDAKLSYNEIASKSGVGYNHLKDQIDTNDKPWGAKELALVTQKLVRKHDGTSEDPIRVQLTARGAKLLEKAKSIN